MFRGRTLKIFVLVILLIVGLSDVSLAVATVSDALCAAYDSSNSFVTQSTVIEPTFELTGQVDSPFAAVGLELLKVPTVDAAANAVASVVKSTSNYKVMPAAPAAFLMVIIGFLCISLVKDRKNWLAACVGLVCLGQLSISALPRLASNLRNALKSTEVSSVISHCTALDATSFRVRSEVEGTAYIGLLRKLSGIGDDDRSSSFNARSTTDTVCGFVISTHQNLTYKVSALAAHITSLYNFDLLLACWLRSAGQISVFSPALIISNLPHGPPV